MRSEMLELLMEGKTVSLEGCNFKRIEGEIQPGDWYIAERNTGPRLLVCKENNKEFFYIVPTTWNYWYDTSECVRVEEV